jgi:hypothetical protein
MNTRTKQLRAKVILKRALVCGAVTGVIAAALILDTTAYADDRPASPAVASAKATSDLMLATLFAALTQEFAETTPANVEQGKQSISLIFNDKNKDMRLVGVLNPLHATDIPQDGFEAAALAYAMSGQNFDNVQRVDNQWYYRRSVALSNFHPACMLCHTNFGPTNDKKWVGALMLRVPVVGQ